jgi:hypothetical protein
MKRPGSTRALGVIPADQRLGPGELAGGEIHLGLVVQHEFIPIERLAQPIFNAERAGRRFVHFLCVEQVAIAAHLGLLDRGFRILEQGVGVGAIVREHDDSHLGCDPVDDVIDAKRMTQERRNFPFQHRQHVAFVGHDRHHHRKLIRSHARRQTDVAGFLRQPLRHLYQQRVPGWPAEAVIEILEALQIEHEHRQLVPGAGGGGDVLRDAVKKQAAVRKSGERIVVGVAIDALLFFDIVHRECEIAGEFRQQLHSCRVERTPDCSYRARTRR